MHDYQWSYRDLLMLLISVMVVTLAITLTQVNAKVTREQEQNQAPMTMGNVMVEIRWPDGLDFDADLWVKGPGDFSPVGYSNRGGELFSLVRDDLGVRGDRGSENYENAVSRGVTAGEYVVNVHAYGGQDSVLPVAVSARVVVWQHGLMKSIVTRSVHLGKMGDEETVASFRLDENGTLVPGSLSYDKQILRGSTAVQDNSQQSGE